MKVILYTTGCPKCKILTQKLESANIQYEKITDVDLMVEKGFKSAPVLEVDGVIYGFKEAVEWIKQMD